MMRVAAIYDIHGNLPALEAVLDEIRLEEVDQVVVGGDVVPGPMPSDCVSALQDLSVPVQSIQGNGEREILTLHRGEELTRVPPQLHEAMHWVESQLPEEHLTEFAVWPLTLRLEIPGFSDVDFCHATPRDDNEIFTRITPEARLRPIFEATGAAFVICGHTHMQFDRRIGDVRVINAGSVGMPYGEPGAYWAPRVHWRQVATHIVRPRSCCRAHPRDAVPIGVRRAATAVGIGHARGVRGSGAPVTARLRHQPRSRPPHHHGPTDGLWVQHLGDPVHICFGVVDRR